MSRVVITERQLGISDTEALTVVLYKPENDNHPGGYWKCDLKIGDTVKDRFRVDAFQALLLSLELIHVELDILKENRGLQEMDELII